VLSRVPSTSYTNSCSKGRRPPFPPKNFLPSYRRNEVAIPVYKFLSAGGAFTPLFADLPPPVSYNECGWVFGVFYDFPRNLPSTFFLFYTTLFLFKQQSNFPSRDLRLSPPLFPPSTPEAHPQTSSALVLRRGCRSQNAIPSSILSLNPRPTPSNRRDLFPFFHFCHPLGLLTRYQGVLSFPPHPSIVV